MRKKLQRLAAAAMLLAASGAAALLPSLPAAAAPAQAARMPSGQICGTSRGHARHYDHVIWIWMENTSYDSVIGSSQAPFTNALAGECGLAANYHNLTHPSAPEYLGATSGYLGGANDCSPYQCPDPNYNLFLQLSQAHKTWKSYEESMPSGCYDPASAANPGLNTVGLYDSLHNPALYYTDLRAQCAADDVPMGEAGQGNFAHDLATRLPDFSFITPNKCNDDHDCAVSAGDAYLQSLIGEIASSHVYRSGHTVIFITWDEGEGGVTNDCAYNTTDIGCHVATLVVSPSTRPGTVSSVLFNHYSLLKSTEELFHLPLLGHARDASVNSMLPAFGL